MSRRCAPIAALLLLTAAAPTSADLDALRVRLGVLGADEASGIRKAHDQAERLIALNAAEADLRERMGKNQSSLTKLLAALQMYQRNPPPALLVSPRSAKDAVNAAILMRAITPELRRRADAFAAQSKELNALRRQILVADGEFLATERDVTDRRDAIDALNAERARIEGGTASGKGGGASAPSTAPGSVDDLLQRFQNPDAARGGAVKLGALKLTPPVQGVVVSRFGDPGGPRGKSEGWTWSTAPGAVVASPAAARVDYAGPLKGWGFVLILGTSGGYHLVLAGLEQTSVRVGAEVTAGEPVGHVSAPPVVDKHKPPAASLYLEVRQGAQPVDPARFLGRG